MQTKTITKKELIDRIADKTKNKRVVVKAVVQRFLDEIIKELGSGHRLEFRDFGVFETKDRAPRTAQNPKTLEPVHVPRKRTVKFKVGRLMKAQLLAEDGHPNSAYPHDGQARQPQAARHTPPQAAAQGVPLS
jgi:nucleoid DNA-binding protein